MAAMNRTISIASISSIASDNSVTGKKKKINKNSVTVGFKCNWFKNTLNFVKDDRKLSLNYSVTKAQAIYIRDMLSFEKNPLYKDKKYAPLYEAFKIFGLKFDFSLSRLNKDIIVLQKIPKNNVGIKETDTTAKLSPKEKRVVNKISQKYMAETAETILDFMEDPTRATLEFPNVKPLESMFLQCVMNASRPMFPEHAQMMKYVDAMKPKLDFSLQAVIGKINRKTNERTVTFKKEPKFGKKGRKSRDSSLNRSNISLTKFVPSKDSIPKNSTQNNNSIKLKSTPVDNLKHNSPHNNKNSIQLQRNSSQNNENSTQLQQNTPRINENPTQLQQNSLQNNFVPMEWEENPLTPVQKSGMNETSVPGIESPDLAVKPLEIDNFGSQNSSNLLNAPSMVRNFNWDALDARKTKLVEAMSVPVQLDKPARMMQKIGWRGGPLGCRGVGITQPIMPALGRVFKAGLGHVKDTKLTKNTKIKDTKHENTKPKDTSNKSTTQDDLELYEGHGERNSKNNYKLKSDLAEFRLEVLEAILELIQTERREIDIVYDSRVKEKGIGFVKHVLRAFTERARVTLSDRYENNAAKQIVNVMKKLSGTVLSGAVSECKRIITIKKTNIGQTNAPNVITVETMLKLVRPEIFGYQTSCRQKKIGFHMTILSEILDLLRDDKNKIQLVFEKPLSNREEVFVENAVKSLNIGKNICAGRLVEETICRDIMNLIGDRVLSVKIDEFKLIVTFTKRLRPPKNNQSDTKTPRSNVNEIRNTEREIIALTGTHAASNSIPKTIRVSINNLSSDRNKTVIEVPNNSDLINNKVVNADVNIGKENTVPKVQSNNNSEERIVNNTNKSKDNLSTSNVLENSIKINKIIDNSHSLELNNPDNSIYDEYRNDHIAKDDDVIIIETKHETIVISDDESNDTNLNEKSVTLNSLEKELALRIKRAKIKGNFENNNKGIVDSGISNSADVDSQNYVENDISCSQGALELDISKIVSEDDITNKCLALVVKTGKESIELSESKSKEVQICDIYNNLNIKANIIPQKEKSSYSEEFDKDLLDLEMVLGLDDNVFDYTIVKKEDINKTDRPMSKRSRSDSETSSPDNLKKTKIFTFKNSKNVLIVPKDYPDIEIRKECTMKIQTFLSDAIENCDELPLLKCHGIQDGGLMYSCHNEQSLFFIEKCISVASDYKMLSDVKIKNKPHKLKLRLNSLLDDLKKLLSRLELYNAGLITDSWRVNDTEKYEDHTVISLEVDAYSYKYICDNSFCLYAGIDEVSFTVVWD